MPHGSPDIQIATRDEKVSALLALQTDPKISKRLLGYAASELRVRQKFANHMTEEDLLQDAFAAALSDERKWYLRREPFDKFMFGVIHSIARDLIRTKAGKLDGATLSLEDMRIPADAEDVIVDEKQIDLDTPEAILQAKQQFEGFLRELEDDQDAWCVLGSMRERGLSAEATREYLQISVTEFEAIRKKISRRFQKFFFSH